MRKIFKAGICVMAAAVVMTGCSGKDKTAESQTAAASEAESSSTAETEGYVETGSIKLGNYKGIEVTVTEAEVTDEEVEAQIQQTLNSSSEYIEVERAAKEGDQVNIDYVGTKDGTAFDGGTAEGYDLVLGSGNFIDGFEDGLIGAKKGDKKDLNLTFPDPYTQNPDLAGKPVVFAVTVNSVKEKTVPELNDEFVQKVSPDDKTTAAYRETVKKNLLEQKQYDIESQRNYDIVNAIMNDSEIVCSSADVDKEYDSQLQSYTSQAAMYGMDLAGMASIYGMDEDGLKIELRLMAQDVAKQRMMFEEVAKQENLTVEDADIEALAEDNGMSREDLVASYGQDQVDEAALTQKVMNFLVENAKITVQAADAAPAAESAETAESTEAAESTTAQ